MSDVLTDAQEQLRMASPAEREMREMLMKIGGDDPDERSKHGVPRQPCATTVLVAIAKTAIKRGSKTTAISSRNRTTGETIRVRMQDDSDDDGRGKGPRVVTAGSQKMETDQGPLSDLPPVLEDDDLHARVIEVMTDVEVLLDGCSMINMFAVNSARRKRVEVSERKLTVSDRGFFRKAQELELQSWLDHRVFDLVKKKIVDQERESCEQGGS